MAENLEALRSECEALSKKRFRAALTTLLVLFLAVIVFTRAFWRIDRDEVHQQLSHLVTLAKAAETKPNLSYIFSQKFDEMARESEGDLISAMPAAPAERNAKQQALAAATDRLEQLAQSWFTLKIWAGGPAFELDPRWLVLLPLLLWTASVHLGVVGAKLRMARRIGAAQVDRNGAPFDRLAFAERSAYSRYPGVLGARLYVALMVCLLGLFLFVSAPFRELLWGKDEALLGGTLWPAQVLCLITYYVAVLIWAVRWRMERQADAILGTETEPFLAVRLLERVRRVGRNAQSVASRVPRTIVTLGAAAILTSPFTMLATTCRHEPRSGADLLFSRDEARWFTASDFGESFIPDLGRWFYAATILLAIMAIATVVFTASGRASWTRAARRLRPFAATAALFMLVEASFVFLAWIFVLQDVIRIVAVAVPVLLWIRNRRRERWHSVIRPKLEVLLLPAVILAPMTLIRCHAFGLTGLPFYFAGMVLLALPLLVEQDAEARDALPAPAYSSG